MVKGTYRVHAVFFDQIHPNPLPIFYKNQNQNERKNKHARAIGISISSIPLCKYFRLSFERVIHLSECEYVAVDHAVRLVKEATGFA